eukprot:TRINITY_DN1309_c0_g1_i1.p1 TRINITY_DN1309_c0_g1~~TRINITY_DN1309_c0_g1_i1.p1  ORF type:complete len:245 (+),score=40.11 TRINITY_DN1309_c0_g1_i1:60-737(+)
MTDSSTAKYWYQRYHYFSKFDEGIQLDREGWFSVSPEALAAHTADRMLKKLGPDAVIVDAMSGCGGNTIQFAVRFHKVIAIDTSLERLNMARHNAKIYGVEDRIQYIHGDFMKLAETLVADAVFLSPPWGGPGYLSVDQFWLDSMVPDGVDLFRASAKISPNIAYYLPRNVEVGQLAALAGKGATLEVEEMYINSKFKVITVYYGSLPQSGMDLDQGTSHAQLSE